MIRFVVTTFPSEEVAARVVRELVETRHAACGTLVPGARSIYRWKDELQDDAEVLAIFKTSAAGYASFEQALRQRHPYETPEIATFDPAAVSADYATWVLANCTA